MLSHEASEGSVLYLKPKPDYTAFPPQRKSLGAGRVGQLPPQTEAAGEEWRQKLGTWEKKLIWIFLWEKANFYFTFQRKRGRKDFKMKKK